ncbi:MAG: hypothetical protein FWE67_09815 [Planctomycetaceae bacterium]|nr:hypothetical protein [Planctomycetaceae bacterium]
MNLLGKMFILLIFVLSITFMVWSVVIFMTPPGTKDKEKEVSERLQKAQSFAKQQTESRDDMVRKLNEEISNRAVAISTLTVKVDELDKENKKSRDDLMLLNEQKEQRMGDVKRLNTAMAEARTEVDGLRKDLQTVQKDWASEYSDLVAKVDEAHSLAIKLANYRSVGERLAKDYRDATEVLIKHGWQPEDKLQNSVTPKGIHGTITEVRPNGWVEISIGSDSGIAEGHRLDVVRNVDGRSSYIGRIEVVRAEADCSAARILPEYRRGTIQQDDIVENIKVNKLAVKY